MRNLSGVFFSWLPFAITIIFIYGAIYLTIQQHTRLSADETLAQLAGNIKEKMEDGLPPALALRGLDTVDMSRSLSPYAIIYNESGALLASSATAHGRLPSPPPGVLAYAKKTGENRRTWQADNGVRTAIVVLPVSVDGKDGFVLAGKALKEEERMEQVLHNQATIAAVITLVAAYFAVLIKQFTKKISVI